MTFTLTEGQERVVSGWRTRYVVPFIAPYLHSSIKHSDGRGRPHESVSVGFSFKDPATLKRPRFTPKVSRNKTLAEAHFHIKSPAEQRREQPQIGHYELLWEAELDSDEEETETLRNVLW